jgi:hypothetical protein
VNARLQNGLALQAGVSTGKSMEDNCEIVAKLPEMNLIAAINGATLPASWRAQQFCRRESPFLTSGKVFGVYVVPKIDVQVSGTFRSVPGQITGINGVSPANGDVNVGFAATNAFLTTNSTLGRALAGNQANVVLQLLEPQTTFLDRRNELDVRIGKLLRVGRHRALLSVDFFNALNSNAIVNVNQASNLAATGGGLASYLRPTEILNARATKFTVTYDF